MAAGNRKERRAKDSRSQASKSTSGFQPTTELDEDGVEMILKHPDYSGPKGKSLFDLAEERQKELDKASGRSRTTNASSENDVEIGPVGDAILYSMSMAALHTTLDVIVFSQYREDIVYAEIAKRAATALPVFMLLVYLTHVKTAHRFPLLRNLAFFAGSIVAGCYLVYSGNKHGYFQVMKAAPPVGTLWVWSVIEMSLPFAALNAISVVGYIWWNGYNVF